MRLFDFLRRRPADLQDDIVRELRQDGTLSLTLTGLADRGTRDLRIDAVPPEIEHAARDLMRRLADLAARQGLRNEGETIGGPLVNETQPVMHMATLRVASRDQALGADDIFRVVDFGCDVASGLPRQLLATHLAVWNRPRLARRQRVEELRWSVHLFPGAAAKGDVTFAFDRGENIGNWAGWNALGELLVEKGQIEEGLAALSEAALRCPPWARDFAAHVADTIARTRAKTNEDPRLAFWINYRANHWSPKDSIPNTPN